MFQIQNSKHAFRISNFEFRIFPKGGFTLLEVLIVLGILGLVGGIAITSFFGSRNIRELATSGENVLSVLRLAQAKALGSEDGSQWGVWLGQSRVILFRGPSFAGSTSTQIFDLPSNLEIVNINLAGGGQEVLFKRLDGGTDNPGTFDARVRSATNFIFPIVVDGSGKVYQSATAPSPTGTRIIDARHRQFNLGWSIQNSIQLVLVFSNPPGPNSTTTVTMASYFDVGKTKFDWTDTVVVGGQNQTLRIHTTLLNSVNTTLSVDRDCRKNTKKVDISIDSGVINDLRNIATYEADCQTIAVGAFGGTMSEP